MVKRNRYLDEIMRHDAAVMQEFDRINGNTQNVWTAPDVPAPKPAAPAVKKEYDHGDARGNGVIGAIKPYRPGNSPEEILAERKADPNFKMSVEDSYGQRD